MKRTIFAISLGTLALLTAIMPVAASKGWCRTDPIVSIGGRTADILVAGPQNAPELVTGPTRVYVLVPVGVPTSLIASDMGFGYGAETVFQERADLQVTADGIEVIVTVFVPSTDNTMPVLVEFAPFEREMLRPIAAVEGTANSWVTLEVTF
jgi:hypothetical protein